MNCSHRVEFEHLVLLNESVAPVLVAVVDVRGCFRVTRKRGDEFDDIFEFIVEGIGGGFVIFVLESP